MKTGWGCLCDWTWVLWVGLVLIGMWLALHPIRMPDRYLAPRPHVDSMPGQPAVEL